VEPYLIGAVVVVAGAQMATLWFMRRQQAAFDQVENRVAHLTAAISLLTDTTEGALRDVLHRAEQVNASPVRVAKVNGTTAPKANGATRSNGTATRANGRPARTNGTAANSNSAGARPEPVTPQPETVTPRSNGSAARRVNGAARKGRSVQDIAAAEKMSEGEVRLRLQLSQPPAAGEKGRHVAAEKERHAKVC
jgi:hypothetical protein